MEIRKIQIKDIRESEFNPRVRLEKGSPEYEQIADSIREFGFIEPLVVNGHNMRLVGGHQRLQVLKDMGAAAVECVMINEPDEDREKVLCLALNKIKGDWDMEKLAADLGVEVKRTMNKSEIAALLCAVTEFEVQPGGNGEALPELGAEGPVE